MMVFNLCVFEGEKHREIAAQIRISEESSKSLNGYGVFGIT